VLFINDIVCIILIFVMFCDMNQLLFMYCSDCDYFR
jgi:hypothetical protein